MYVSRLRLRNWRNFTGVDVKLGETVYLIGPNASGKSNLLDIFRFMRDIVDPSGGGLQRALVSRGGLKRVRSLAARRAPQVEIEVELRESLDDCSAPPDWRYVLSINGEGRGKHRPVVIKEEAYKADRRIFSRPDGDDENDPERLTQTHLEQINMNREFREIAVFFESVLYLHLIPQLLKFGEQLSLVHMESDPFGQGFLEAVAKTSPKIQKFACRG